MFAVADCPYLCIPTESVVLKGPQGTCFGEYLGRRI